MNNMKTTTKHSLLRLLGLLQMETYSRIVDLLVRLCANTFLSFWTRIVLFHSSPDTQVAYIKYNACTEEKNTVTGCRAVCKARTHWLHVHTTSNKQITLCAIVLWSCLPSQLSVQKGIVLHKLGFTAIMDTSRRILCVGFTCIDMVNVVKSYPEEDTDQRRVWRQV